jgi:hypothetical protein
MMDAPLCYRTEMRGASSRHLTPNPHALTSLRWKHMEVGKEHAGEKWTDILGWHQGVVTIAEDGWGDFYCSGESVSIWVKVGARGRDGF